MSLNSVIRTGARMALLSAVCAGLASCAAVGDIFSGDDDDIDVNAPPRAERIPILTSEQVLGVDPETAGPVVLPAPYVNPSWPQTGGDPGHAMQHPQGGSLARIWRRGVGQGDGRNSRITAQPVVENGRIYVMDGDGEIFALEAQTGRQIWRRVLRSDNDRDRLGFGGGVAVAQGRVYVASGLGMMSALNADTGDTVWTTQTSLPMHSAPTVADGRVFAVTKDNVLMVFDAASGDRLWSFQGIAEPARLMTSPAPAVAGEIVVAPFGSGELTALQASNGAPVWQEALTRAGRLAPIATLNDVAGSPVIYDGVVYAMSHSGVLAALSLQTGERLWQQPVGGVHMPWLAGDTLFVMSADAQLVAFDRHTGAVRWLTQLPGFKNEERRRGKISWAGPTLIGGRLVVISSEGDGHFYDAATGRLIGEFDAGKSFISPVVADQTLYVLGSNGDMSAYR
jgi:outer membrane protein assembly factor BamB